jgi:hypothetical protein
MFARICNKCWIGIAALCVFFFTTTSLRAQGTEEVKAVEPVWVVSFAIMILFLGLAIAILLRPTKRDDSAFSYDELQAQKEEEMKRLKGGH